MLKSAVTSLVLTDTALTEHPAAPHLVTLASGSRLTMRQALDAIALVPQAERIN
ncbi:MAG TPA: hypothetical protein V6D09_19140 [Leptolyngbyaceae cyanobacterium]